MIKFEFSILKRITMKNAAAINGFLIRTKNLSNEISFFIQYNYNTILKFNYHHEK